MIVRKEFVGSSSQTSLLSTSRERTVINTHSDIRDIKRALKEGTPIEDFAIKPTKVAPQPQVRQVTTHERWTNTDYAQPCERCPVYETEIRRLRKVESRYEMIQVRNRAKQPPVDGECQTELSLLKEPLESLQQEEAKD